MILPIYAYGNPVLKKEAKDISPDYPELPKLLEDMWETLYHANGIGLAAPQIGKPIRIFMVDTAQLDDNKPEPERTGEGIKKVFINAEILEEAGDDWTYEEGCLSIPDVSGDVDRPEEVTIRYYDENFELHEETYDGMNARVIQHEYDHIDGILFTEHLKPVKKQLVRRKLESIRKGKAKADYPIVFYTRK
jgi:peptide deformylase